MAYYEEPFTDPERAILGRFFTNTDLPVFALINLPEVVKGALFARYSRSAKSIRRLFLDEFFSNPESGIEHVANRLQGDDSLIDLRRAEQLYQRVFFEYGDDSVAQLGSAHLACEQASNLLTKVLEWGRLAAYLEQSTRYIYYDVRLGDRYRYHVPPEVARTGLATEYVRYMDDLFESYSQMASVMQGYYEKLFPRSPEDSVGVWNATIRAKACDAVRGLLPAATLSNVGIHASGQAYEMALLRMGAHPLAEVRDYGAMMLTELRRVIPSFLTRVDLPDRGVLMSAHLADVSQRLQRLVPDMADSSPSSPLVRLIDWDREAEVKLAAACLFAVSELNDGQLLEIARRMSSEERQKVLAAAIGDRTNRRHKPGRPFERTMYRFEVVCDFGAFRDLQRHRLMTIEWQRLTTRLGYDLPPDLGDVGLEDAWRQSMERATGFYEEVRSELGADVAQYVVPFAYNVRFVIEMNPRQAFHMIELRSQPAGHPGYRKVVQEMHKQIAEVAGHTAIAEAMSFVDFSTVELERLEGERRAEAKRASAAG